MRSSRSWESGRCNSQREAVALHEFADVWHNLMDLCLLSFFGLIYTRYCSESQRGVSVAMSTPPSQSSANLLLSAGDHQLNPSASRRPVKSESTMFPPRTIN